MNKIWIIGGLALIAVAAAQSSPYSFLFGGKPAKLETIDKNGKVFVDLAAFAKNAGLTLRYDKAKRTYTVTGQSSDSSGAAGTQQLAGGVGKVGAAVTLGKASPLNFTLRGLEYSVGRVNIGPFVYAPEAKQKLVILHFTAQNPQKDRDAPLNGASFTFTLVDSSNVSITREAFGADSILAKEGESVPLDTALKPGQRLDVYTAFVVPNSTSLPKLIVERTSERAAGVVRYDLGGLIKPLVAPFSPDGSNALENVAAQVGTFYPLRWLDLNIESVKYSSLEPGNVRPNDGKRFVSITGTLRNSMPQGAPSYERGVCSGGITMTLRDAEGSSQEVGGCNSGLFYRLNSSEELDWRAAPGQTVRFRTYIEVSADASANTLSVVQENSRVYQYDLSSLK